MRILIAEHDKTMSRQLQRALAIGEHDTLTVHDGDEAVREALRNAYDLVILAVKLPGQNGFAVTRELRRLHVTTPILFLSELTSVPDKVTGLDSGADDYMTKPFDGDELLARVRALTRRYGSATPSTLTFGDLEYRFGNASLVCGGQEIRLNYKEGEIIKLLMTYHQHILSKEELIQRVWGYSAATSDNNVEAYISFLRKKLKTIGSQVTVIAIKKQGYKLEVREMDNEGIHFVDDFQ